MLMQSVRPWGNYLGFFLALTFLTGLFAGCARSPRLGHLEPPPVEAAERVATSSNALTFELLSGLSRDSDGGNVIISPLSVSSLLAMLLAGANGATADAIASVLHFDNSSPGGAVDFGHLLRYLAVAGGDVDLTIANAVWANKGYPLKDDFVNNLQDNFGAEVNELDLGSQQGADTIDGWVSDKTKGLIEKMSDALRLPDPQAVIVLMNAVYFKGNWTYPFEKERTHPGEFRRLDGSTVAVPMMTQDREYEVAQGDGFTLVRLPYGKSQRFAMDVLVPDAQQDPERFIRDLDEAVWEAAVTSLKKQRVNLLMPRFELEYKAAKDLDDRLKELGMGIAYSPQTDFSPMSPSNPALSRVAHKTYIRVDEQGTEAAGVTGGVMVESMPPQFNVDHPFAFTISDTETETILFAGFVTDPAAE